MVGFIVPFKAKSQSKNWEQDCLLLSNTLRSICNQLNNDYQVFVVYTDLPENIQENEKVILVHFPFSFIKNGELRKIEFQINPNSEIVIDERMFDQGKRILFGCTEAIKHGCLFVMSIDADDLISNRISLHIQVNSNEKIGWYVDKGYILNSRMAILLKVNKNMNYLNGSTHIVHVDLLPKIDFESKRVGEFSFFSAHGYLKDRIKGFKGESLKPLPFRALIYLVHEFNWSGLGRSMQRKWFKSFIKYLIFGKYLSKSIKREFGFNT